jgi:CarD family transcriptional regulator
MTFEIDDSVVHPQHGVGEITKIIDEELVAGFDQYYVIAIHGQDLTLHVPVVKAYELGLRHTMSQPNLQTVIEVLRDKPHQLPGDYKERQSRIREKLSAAMPVRIAEVVRDLGWRKDSAHLSNQDASLLERSRRLLAREIAVVNDVKIDHALQLIDHNVKISFIAATAAAESA